MCPVHDFGGEIADNEWADVTKELDDLRVVVGNYDMRASKLQAELQLAHNDFCDLLYSHEYPKSQFFNNDNQNQTHLMNENFCETYKSKKKQTEEKSIQTDLTINLTCKQKEKHKSNCPDKFTLDLLDVTFQLQEKLAKCHAKRRSEMKSHEEYTNELSRTHSETLKQIQEKQKHALTEFKHRIEKSTRKELDALKQERIDLLTKLHKTKESEQQSRHVNTTLEIKLHKLENELKLLQEKNQLLESKTNSKLLECKDS